MLFQQFFQHNPLEHQEGEDLQNKSDLSHYKSANTDVLGVVIEKVSGVKAYHKVIGDFKLAGNPIKMSAYKDEKTRGDIPDLDEHREKILKEFN